MHTAYFGKNYELNRRFSMDEVNHLASNIGKLQEAQKNTMFPKMVETLEGLDWSDNLFTRLDRQAAKNAYTEINEMVKNFEWLKPIMQRSSFRVPYNRHIDAVIENRLFDRDMKDRIAKNDTPEGLKDFYSIVKHSTFGKELLTKEGKKKLYNYKERLQMLNQMVRQAEDFMSNDLADIATLKNIDRIFKEHKVNPKRISTIHRQVELFKARSYLSKRERRELDYGAYLDTPEGIEAVKNTQKLFDFLDAAAGKKAKKKDLIGDERSASWDQFQLDEKIRAYKKKLTGPEKELFDHFMVGSLNRGNLALIDQYLAKLPGKAFTPMFRDLITKAIKDAARTSQSRLAFNSEAISDMAIQNHFRAMNEVYADMWKPPTEKEVEKTVKETKQKLEDNNIGTERNVMDELVQSAHDKRGYAGIKEGQLSKEDAKVITEIASYLKYYNNKTGNNLPELNEIIRGLTSKMDPEGMGKDLNALHGRDFVNIRNFLREHHKGLIHQRIWKSKNPEMFKRYWSLFPETTNRALMKHDILWLKKEGFFVTNDGTVKKGIVRRPTYFLDVLGNILRNTNDLSTGKAESIVKEIEMDFVNLTEHKEGDGLFRVAVAQRELGIKDTISNMQIPENLKKYYKLVYDKLRTNTEKEFNWKKIKDKEFTVLNDANERVTATGFEIVNGASSKNLTGIKQKLTKRFESLHKLITGDKDTFNKYKTGKFFNNDRSQPVMNWEKFVTDVEKAMVKGKTLEMDIGIDGMRHIARSMMFDLGGKDAKSEYAGWIIKDTGAHKYDAYWPHMFFDKRTAENSMKNAIKFIQEDPTLSKAERQKAIDDIAIRHKTVTGEWEFGDMQSWDRVDQLELHKSFGRIADKKKSKKDVIKTEPKVNPQMGSMFSRKGHIPGWSTDMNVLNAYTRNITNTYYRQMNQILGRRVIDEAYKRMHKKFGKEYAGRWNKFFKLYLQGAMGEPDVIPEDIYNDPAMKLKGTPYSWFADNRVLKRVNSIRQKLGIRESDLPKELKDFTYHDIRHWSNMEAKYELASLLAHPKSSITNVFGGSLHTIQSAGPGAFFNARSIKYLQRINPEWKSLRDVTDWVIGHGVVPEFMVHELGLTNEGKVTGGMRKFVGELKDKINSKEKVTRGEIFTLGKKHGLNDFAMDIASKFMSVPERGLRRDAFMAHYIRAWERFGGSIKDPNHPFLIEMGKKGVKATQFLYEAPNRPFFARTALGKVMTRFQLFAWNSVRFRNDVNRLARMHGYKQGTAAYDKFKRTMTIDLLVIAMANMFNYSLFDTAMPQPYSWMQDTAEWMFGDEKEREKAFFGQYPTAIAPLQVISPPFLRVPVTGLQQLIRDDYTKFSEYHVYSAFPFGRIGRDLVQPGKGLWHNPSRVLEKLAGIPIRNIQRYTTQRRKDIEEGTRYKIPRIGVYD